MTNSSDKREDDLDVPAGPGRSTIPDPDVTPGCDPRRADR